MLTRHFGLSLVVIAWIAVLLTPTLRLLLQRQVWGSYWQQQSVLPAPAQEPYEQLAALYPNDPRFLVKIADEGWQRENQTIHNLDRLLQRFPNQPWLYAMRLSRTMQWFRDDRTSGDLGNPNYPAPPPLNTSKPSFSQQELAQAIKVAQQAQRVEPGNAFFDWALFYLLYAGHRDAEALQALHKGASKSRFNDYCNSAPRTIAMLEQVRPLTLEEKLALGAPWVEINFPMWAKYREMARRIAWEGIKAARAGDNRRALQIYGDLAHIGARMREGSQTFTEGLVAIALESIATGVLRYHGKYSRKRIPQAQRIVQFQKYATAHGRADLVREVRQQYAEQLRFRQRVRASINSDELVGGLSSGTLVNIAFLRMIGTLLLLAICSLTPAWLLTTLALWRLRSREGPDNIALQWHTLAVGSLMYTVIALSPFPCDIFITVASFGG